MRRLTELVAFTTADNVGLNGSLWEPGGRWQDGVDAFLMLGGTMATFYSAIQQLWINEFYDLGLPVLAISHRGHDLAWRNRPDGRLLGFSHETVADCVHDIRAALDLLRTRGYRRIGLFGHSLGAVKSFYYLSEVSDPGVTALIAISVPRMCRSRLLNAPRSDEYQQNVAEAERLVAAGRGQDIVTFSHPQGPAPFTPVAYLDKYGSDRYDTLPRAERIPVPMLLTRGSEEREIMPDGYLETLLERAPQRNLSRSVLIEGADHFYTGGYTTPTVAAIRDWLADLERAAL